MAHGFSAVKEMYLDAYAEAFAAVGLAVLVFDNRSFGASDGEPRQEIDPWLQVRDYRHAITWAQLQDGLDGERVACGVPPTAADTRSSWVHSIAGSGASCRRCRCEPGSYDGGFTGCSVVFHLGAAIGFNQESPQQVYDGCHTDVAHVLASARASGSLRRFVFTSSLAAVAHPRPEGYVFTEKDWCSDNREHDENWSADNISTNWTVAYAMAKANTEQMLYQVAEGDGSFDAIAVLPAPPFVLPPGQAGTRVGDLPACRHDPSHRRLVLPLGLL